MMSKDTKKPVKRKITPAVKRAAKDLRKGSGDAGLAMEERKQLLRKKKPSKSKKN